MISILVSFGILLITFESFNVNIRKSSADQIIEATPNEYFKNAVYILDEEDEPYLYFEKDKIEETLNHYYSSLSQYLTNYSLEFYYFSPVEKMMCLVDKCQGIEINVSGTIDYIFSYRKSLSYHIERRLKGGEL